MANQHAATAALTALEEEVRAKLHWRELVIGEGMDGKSLQRHTPFEDCALSAEERQAMCVRLARVERHRHGPWYGMHGGYGRRRLGRRSS